MDELTQLKQRVTVLEEILLKLQGQQVGFANGLQAVISTRRDPDKLYSVLHAIKLGLEADLGAKVAHERAYNDCLALIDSLLRAAE